MGGKSALILTSVELKTLTDDLSKKMQCNYDRRLVQQKIDIHILVLRQATGAIMSG